MSRTKEVTPPNSTPPMDAHSKKHRRRIRISVVLPVTVELLVGSDDDPSEDVECEWEVLSVLSAHCETTPRGVTENMDDKDFEALVAAATKAKDLP